MSSFYFNHHSGESAESQWTRHTQNQTYVEDLAKSVGNSVGQQTRDLSNIVTNQTKEINETIQNASREQAAAIQDSTNAICGSLEYGFSILSDDLHEISYGIDELRSEVNAMASMLDWKLSLFIEQQRISNLLLGNIAILLRIPDIQKERQYHIEKGIKFLKSAIIDNDFYDDSLTNLLRAESIEPTDYFVLHRIGLIYLYSPKYLKLNKAEDYFKKAAKYAIAEINVGADVTNNVLAGDLNKNLSGQTQTVDSIRLQAAESYLFASRSCYIQGKLNESADLAALGFNLVPQMVEAGFMQAKALAANNKDTQASQVLEKVINTDRFYSLKVLSDLDLCPKTDVQILLRKLQKEATDKAVGLLKNCKQQLIAGSNASDYITKLEGLVSKNTYLTSKKAIDLFAKVRDWNFCDPYENPNQTGFLQELGGMIITLLSLQFYKERDPIKGDFIRSMNEPLINDFIEKLNQDTQWTFPPFSIISSNPNWKEHIKSKSVKSSVVHFVEAERKMNDNLPKVVSIRRSLLRQYEADNNEQLIFLDDKRKKANQNNYAASIWAGFLGSLMGAGAGFVAGFVVVLLISLGFLIKTGSFGYESQSTFLITSIIGFVAGAFGGFYGKRKKR